MRTQAADTMTRRTLALFGGIVVLALLAVMLLRAFTLVPSFDGGMNLQVAWSIAEGGGYSRSYADQSPFPREIQTNGPYILVASLGYRLFGMGIAQSQISNAFFLLVLVTAAFLLARRMRGHATDGVAAALLLLATPGLASYGFRGFGEIPGLALVVGGVALYPWTEPGSRIRMAGAAMLLGAAVVTKTVMLVCVAPVGLVMALHAATRTAPPASRAAGLAVLGAGFVAPIVAWELFRLASLGGGEAYRAWWLLEYRSISQEAGIAATPEPAQSLLDKVGQHLRMLSAFLHLPIPFAMAWLLLPFAIAAAAAPSGTRHARWILLAVLAAVAAYFLWWLALTPTAKAWHRRIFNGMVLVNLAWILAGAALGSGTASRLRRRAAAAAIAVGLCLAAFFLVQAGKSGDFDSVDSSPIDRAVEMLASLPSDASVYAAGWSSAPQISLLARRPLLDINDTPADQLQRSAPAYLVVDQESGLTTENGRVLAMYPSAPLVPNDTLPQIYRFDPRILAAEPAPSDLSAPVAFNRLDDAQVAGFHKAENHGRWAGADVAIRTRVSPGDSIVIALRVLPPERYQGGTPPMLTVSLDGCELPPFQTTPGVQTIAVPVAPCSPVPDEPATLRIRSDALLDSPITIDERGLSFIAQCIQLDPGTSTQMTTSIRLASASLALALAACGGDTSPVDQPATGQGEAVQAPASNSLPWTLDETVLAPGALMATRGACSEPPFAAEVRWSLLPAHGAKPEIWIATPGHPPKLWIAPSQREGTSRTGAWLNDATILYLVDGIGNSVISRLRMDSVACEAPVDPQAASVGNASDR